MTAKIAPTIPAAIFHRPNLQGFAQLGVVGRLRSPYAESIFRTCKYRPDYPYKGFETIVEAREWLRIGITENIVIVALNS